MQDKGEIYSGLGKVHTKDDDESNSMEKPISRGIKLHLLASYGLCRLARKPKHNDFFDIVFISQTSMLGVLSDPNKMSSLNVMLKQDANIFVETTKFLFPLESGQKQAVDEYISHYSEDQNWKCLKQIDSTGIMLYKKI